MDSWELQSLASVVLQNLPNLQWRFSAKTNMSSWVSKRKLRTYDWVMFMTFSAPWKLLLSGWHNWTELSKTNLFFRWIGCKKITQDSLPLVTMTVHHGSSGFWSKWWHLHWLQRLSTAKKSLTMQFSEFFLRFNQIFCRFFGGACPCRKEQCAAYVWELWRFQRGGQLMFNSRSANYHIINQNSESSEICVYGGFLK